MNTALPTKLDIALKEWAVVCQALETGRQVMLLRKGGILESRTGFEVEHPQFLLFPTYLHQSLNQLKPEVHAGFQPHASEPQSITLGSAAEVTDIIRLKHREQMNALDSEHIWTPPLLDMRFNYKPQNPLYLLIVRVHKLSTPQTVQNTPAYAGCKSWVPLEQAVEIGAPAPVLDDAQFQRRRSVIQNALG
jgi:hypothetical protein